MSTYQLLIFPTLAAAVLVLGGALKEKPAIPQPPLAVGSTPDNDLQALEILDRAIAALAPDRVQWLQTTVWQQVRCEDFIYQACGRLLMAPEDRSRFDLNIRVGKTCGELRMVNDGKTLFQSVRVAEQEPVTQRWQLPTSNDRQKDQAEVARARTRLMHEQGFTGLSPMLHTLRQRVQSARVGQHHWNGRVVHLVSAAWPRESAAPTSAPETFVPRFQVRQCCVYLDAETLWPHRIEWWGAERAGDRSQLLTQMEFREPVLNQPLSAERCAAEFAVNEK